MDDTGSKARKLGITRRTALQGLASAAFAGSAVAQQAMDPVADALQRRAAEWGDSFDSTASSTPNVRTAAPILSPETYASSQAAIQRYSDIVARGGWGEIPTDRHLRLGVRDNAVVALRERLISAGDMSGSTGMSETFDSYVDAGVKRFQARHGIPPDGVAGAATLGAMNIPAQTRLAQLTKNADRLRPLATRPPIDRFVMANIPAAQIEAVQNGRVVSRHTAIVGKIDRPSPILNSKISEINFNPYWTVPVSIIRRDLIPLVRKEPDYLSKQRIHIYDSKGAEVSQDSIDWNTDQATRYRFRQDPGEWNSMGSVKINFPSPEGSYMHDTPNKGLFNDDFRFDSSGCIRVSNIRQIITWILQDTPGWNREQVDRMFRVSDRLDVKVVKPVQLNWVYLTAWAQDSVVHFRDDIYLQDGIGNLAPMTHPAAVAANQAGQGGQAPMNYGAAGSGPTYTNSVAPGGQPANGGYSGSPIPLVDVPRR